MQTEKPPVPNTSKQGFPRHFFALAFIVSLLSILLSGWYSLRLHNHYEDMAKKHLAVSTQVGRILWLDEILTMSARMAAATSDVSYEKRYNHFEPLLTKEIDELRSALPHSEIKQFAQETDEANIALVRIERQAFALARRGLNQDALALLTNDEYLRLKNIYAAGMAKTVKAVDHLIENDNLESHRLASMHFIASAASILVLLLAWFFAARSAFAWVAERSAMEQVIRDMALHDVLTKLPNRRMLIDRLWHALATSKRTGRYGAVLYLDLDNFKPLNDTHGHGMGDLLLIEVAQRIARCIREVDTVARVGGDEFVVILTELDEDKTKSHQLALIVAEKIRSAIAEPYLLTHQKNGSIIEHSCSSSIGVIFFIRHDVTVEDLIEKADMAMLQAKEDGRNLTRFSQT